MEMGEVLNNELILTCRDGDLLNRGADTYIFKMRSGEGSYCLDNLNEEASVAVQNQHKTIYFRSLPICYKFLFLCFSRQ